MTKKSMIVKDVVLPIGVLVGALLIWQIAAWITSSNITVIATFSAIFDIFKDGVFWRSLGATLLRALIAFSVSFVAALALALVSARSLFENVLSLIVTVLRSVPTMAIVLIFILTTSANTTTVLVGMLVLFPTFYAALLPAVKGVDKELVETAIVCGASPIKRLGYVYLPSMAPSIVGNGIAGLSLAVKLVVSAEVLAQTASSIGMMMQSARAYLEMDRLLALTVIVVAVCLIIDLIGKAALSRFSE